MQQLFYVSGKLNDQQQQRLRDAGLRDLTPSSNAHIRTGLDPRFVFQLDGADLRTPKLVGLLKEWGVRVTPVKRFSAQDLERSAWLAMTPGNHQGFPYPRGRYTDEVYQTKSTCTSCGALLEQKAPFRMRHEPDWGEFAIMQLNGEHMVHFVSARAYSDVFAPLGVESMPVLDTDGSELVSVVQLFAEETVDVDASILGPTSCTGCEESVYRTPNSDYYPRVVDEPTGAYVKTNVFFGVGNLFYRTNYVSSELYQAIRDADLRGASFLPTAPETN